MRSSPSPGRRCVVEGDRRFGGQPRSAAGDQARNIGHRARRWPGRARTVCPHVAGVRLASGEEMAVDLVVDMTGPPLAAAQMAGLDRGPAARR